MNTKFDNAHAQILVDERPESVVASPPSAHVVFGERPEPIVASPPSIQILVDEEFEPVMVAPPSAHVVVDEKPETPMVKPSSGALRFSPGTILQLGFMALASITLALVLIEFGSILESLGNWGYVGVAAVEFGNSAMVAIPTPSYLYTFSMGAMLNPFVVGIIGGAFATLGELIGYYLGHRGGDILPDTPLIERFKTWTSRWGAVTLFSFALLPVPFDMAGIWAGAARYPLIRFIPPVALGKTIKITLIALAGYFGMDALIGMASGFGV